MGILFAASSSFVFLFSPRQGKQSVLASPDSPLSHHFSSLSFPSDFCHLFSTVPLRGLGAICLALRATLLALFPFGCGGVVVFSASFSPPALNLLCLLLLRHLLPSSSKIWSSLPVFRTNSFAWGRHCIPHLRGCEVDGRSGLFLFLLVLCLIFTSVS